MMAGEAPIETAQRKATEEASLLHLAGERFRYIGAYSTCFALREQPPSQNGLHSVNLTYQIELTPSETEQLNLSPDEYDRWQWWSRDVIKQLLDTQTALDQVLMQIIHDLDKPLQQNGYV
jgi:hypothetical protein